MAATTVSRPEATRVFQQAVDTTIRENGEVGMQVAVYHDGQLVVDVWGGIADETTGRAVDGETLFPSFSVIKATTATALHIQAERGLIEYDKPIAEYWQQFSHGVPWAFLVRPCSGSRSARSILVAPPNITGSVCT